MGDLSALSFRENKKSPASNPSLKAEIQNFHPVAVFTIAIVIFFQSDHT
jgi:hypothetical protein